MLLAINLVISALEFLTMLILSKNLLLFELRATRRKVIYFFCDCATKDLHLKQSFSMNEIEFSGQTVQQITPSIPPFLEHIFNLQWGFW